MLMMAKMGGMLGGGDSGPGQAIYTTAGVYSFVVPNGITSVSFLLIGGGGCGDDGNSSDGGGNGGNGGDSAFANNVTVSPGQILTVTVGAGGSNGNGYNVPAQDGGASSVQVGSWALTAPGGKGGRPYSSLQVSNGGYSQTGTAPAGATVGGFAGGLGGGAYDGGGGGGGAASAAEAGSDGSHAFSGVLPISRTTAGGGGGASAARSTSVSGGDGGTGGNNQTGGGGGGATLYSAANNPTAGGNGNNLTVPGSKGGNGGWPGGGGGGSFDMGYGLPSPGAAGAVKIIWGLGRSFPSTASDV